MGIYKKQNPERFATIPTATTNIIGGGGSAGANPIIAVTAAIPGSFYTFDSDGQYPALVKVDDTHALLTYQESATSDLFATVLALNTTTGALTEPASRLQVDANLGTGGSLAQVDSTHYISLYTGLASDIYAVVLAVNTSTWAVTIPGSAFEVKDATTGTWQKIIKIDATHFLAIYQLSSAAPNGRTFAKVLEVNTSTWAITAAGAEATVATTTIVDSAIDLTQIDSTHFVVAYEITGANAAVALSVDTGTWAITVGSQSAYGTAGSSMPSLDQVDGTHVVIAENDSSGAIAALSSVLAINTGTLAISVTTADTVLAKSTNNTCGFDGNYIRKITGTYYLTMCRIGNLGTDTSNAWAVIYVNPSTYAISVLSNWIAPNFSTSGMSDERDMVVLSNNWMISAFRNGANNGIAIAVQTLY